MNVERPNHLTEEQLHGVAEGSLSGDAVRVAQRHLDACHECRSDVERIRALLGAAESLPRAIEPPDDLWPAIQARVRSAADRPRPDGDAEAPADHVSGPGSADGQPGAPHRQAVVPLRRTRREYAWMAAAALLFIVATSAITMLVTRDDRAVASGEAIERNDTLDGPGRFSTVSDEYDRLDRDLARRLEAQREILQPETIEKVERNLQIIDRAIGEIRQALAEDPNNDALEQLLKASYGQKSALLEQVSQS